MLKSAIKRVLRSVGYEVRPIPRSPRVYPFVSHIKLYGMEFSFWVKDATAENWYVLEDHGNLPENRLLKDLVAPGDRVLDIGCHQGFYLTLLAKLVGPNGFVLGVDINPENVMVAQAQIALNGLAGRCEALHRAASASAEGDLGYSDFFTNSTVAVSAVEGGGTAQRTSVDHLCSIYGDFDVLMIDVEGFEEEVLKGARGLLATKKPKLAVEIHSDFFPMYGSTLASVASAGCFSEYAGKMVLRSVDRNQVLPFQLEAIPERALRMYTSIPAEEVTAQFARRADVIVDVATDIVGRCCPADGVAFEYEGPSASVSRLRRSDNAGGRFRSPRISCRCCGGNVAVCRRLAIGEWRNRSHRAPAIHAHRAVMDPPRSGSPSLLSFLVHFDAVPGRPVAGLLSWL